MSADNGILIRRNSDKEFEVRYYNASVDYKSNEYMTLITSTRSLERAIVVGMEQSTEYGLTFEVETFAPKIERYEIKLRSKLDDHFWSLDFRAESFAHAEEQTQSYFKTKEDEIVSITKDYDNAD